MTVAQEPSDVLLIDWALTGHRFLKPQVDETTPRPSISHHHYADVFTLYMTFHQTKIVCNKTSPSILFKPRSREVRDFPNQFST